MNAEIALKTPTISLAIICDSLLEYCQLKGYSLAIWRLPVSSKTYFLVSFQNKKLDSETNIESLPSGFVIAEFEKGIKGEKTFLNADVLFELETKFEDKLQKKLIEQLPGLQFSKQSNTKTHVIKPSYTSVEKSSYTDLVSKAILEIEKGLDWDTAKIEVVE